MSKDIQYLIVKKPFGGLKVGEVVTYGDSARHPKEPGKRFISKKVVQALLDLGAVQPFTPERLDRKIVDASRVEFQRLLIDAVNEFGNQNLPDEFVESQVVVRKAVRLLIDHLYNRLGIYVS